MSFRFFRQQRIWFCSFSVPPPPPSPLFHSSKPPNPTSYISCFYYTILPFSLCSLLISPIPIFTASITFLIFACRHYPFPNPSPPGRLCSSSLLIVGTSEGGGRTPRHSDITGRWRQEEFTIIVISFSNQRP